MRCNNKHILEESNEDENLVRRLLNYVHDEIKGDNNKSIVSNR